MDTSKEYMKKWREKNKDKIRENRQKNFESSMAKRDRMIYYKKWYDEHGRKRLDGSVSRPIKQRYVHPKIKKDRVFKEIIPAQKKPQTLHNIYKRDSNKLYDNRI